MASLSASRTVISFWPEAYALLAIDGVRAAARKAGRKAGAGREAVRRREAGRRSLEATMAAIIVEEQRGRVLPREIDGRGGCIEVDEAAGQFLSEVGDARC